MKSIKLARSLPIIITVTAVFIEEKRSNDFINYLNSIRKHAKSHLNTFYDKFF